MEPLVRPRHQQKKQWLMVLKIAVLMMFASYGLFLVRLSSDDNAPSRLVFGPYSTGAGSKKSSGWCQSEEGNKGGNCVDDVTPHVGEEWHLTTAVLSCEAMQAIATNAAVDPASLTYAIPSGDVLLLQASWCEPEKTVMPASELTRVCLAAYEMLKRTGRWRHIMFTSIRSPSSSIASFLACEGDYEELLQLPEERRHRGFQLYAAEGSAGASFDTENDRLLLKRFRAASTKFSDTIHMASLDRPREPLFQSLQMVGGTESLRGAVVPLRRLLDGVMASDGSSILWKRCNGSSIVLQDRVKAALHYSCDLHLENPMPLLSNIMFNADHFVVLPFPLHDVAITNRFRRALLSPSAPSGGHDDKSADAERQDEIAHLRVLLQDMSTKNIAPTLTLLPCAGGHSVNVSADSEVRVWWRSGKQVSWWATPFSLLLTGRSGGDALTERRTLVACIPHAYSSASEKRHTDAHAWDENVKAQAFVVHQSSLDAVLTWSSEA